MPLRFALVLAALTLALPAAAQEGQTTSDDEPGGGRTASSEQTPYDRLLADYKDPYLEVLALAQALADVPLEQEPLDDLFRVSTARLGVQGELSNGFGYLLRADLADDVSLLDARASYRPIPSVRLAAGRFKTPFSYEALTSAANTDFISRSRAVRAVAPFRQTGIALDAGVDGPVLARVGVFNAPDLNQQAGNDGRLLLVGRVVGRTDAARTGDASGLQLTGGANAAYVPAREGPGDDFPSELRLGLDARLRSGPLVLAAEALRREISFGARDYTVQGGHLTVGADLHPDHRVLARVDYLENSIGPEDARLRQTDLVLGYNVSLSAAVSGQVNAVVPVQTDNVPSEGVELALPSRSSRLTALVQIAL